MISTLLTGLASSHVSDEEYDAEHDAEGAHNDVADGKEVVCSTEHIRRRQNEVLFFALFESFSNSKGKQNLAFDSCQQQFFTAKKS